MTKKILKYILPLLAMTSCSDDFEPNFPGRLEDDGTLYLSFGIAPLQSVSTRSSDVLGEVKMYVYDASGTTQLQSATVDMVGTKGTVLLNSDVINEKDDNGNNVARFYFVANSPAVTGSIDTENGLLGATVTKYENYAEQLTMSSDCIVGVNAVTTNTVSLIHNAAKVSVNKGQKKVTTLTGDDNNDYEAVAATKYAFATYGTSKSGYLMAGGLSSVSTNATSLYLKGYDTTAAYGDLNGATYSVDEKFVLATDNTSVGNAKESFIVVKAAYGTEGLDRKDYYYRLDFQKRVPVEGKTPIEYTTKALDILPNHHYQFLILNISGRGYDTASEAARNPSPMVEYQIHDHSPVIYNMISDGSRELGVQDKGEASSTDDKIEFYVKVFSKDSSEETFTASNLSTEASWISGISVSPVSSSDSNAWGYSPSGDTDNKGSMYKVTLILDQAAVESGLLENTITVAWQGLSREVKLVWDRQFDPSKLFKPEVQLRIYEYEETDWVDGYYLESQKYFTDFLVNKVVGVSSSANSGVSRTQGLHFPMPYGKDDQWSYVYKLSLNSDLASGNFTWEVSAEGVTGIDFSQTSGDQDNLEFYMSRLNSSTDFAYQEGHLNIKITSGGKTTTYTNVKLYHTGFFHDDSPTSAFNNGIVPSITSSPKTKFTYYEVVSGGGDHWLDRNIGASSAGMYVEGGGGDAAARGYYMYISDYVEYRDPIVMDGTVPPGYDVPTVEQWNTLKADGRFNIRMDGAYYIPELKDGTKTVYFPKSMYYEGSDKRGESRAGYYWTRDAASGTEKQEVGNWLKAMCISGTSTSYVNARVNGKIGEKKTEEPFYLSLRAVAKGNGGTKHPQKFQFFVAGATHVYLYIQNADGTRTQAYDWPGKQIGNYETASKTFAFSYETVSANVSDIRVIFNYVGSDKKIYTYSDNDFPGGTGTTHTNISPREAVGWFVLGSDQNKDFKKEDCSVKINTAISQNGTTWAVRGATGTAPAPTETEKTYRILWSQSGSHSQIRISMADGNVVQPFTNPSFNSYGFPDEGDTQYYAFDWRTTLDPTSNSVKLEFKNPSSGEVKIGEKEIYSLTEFKTWIHKFDGIVIGSLKTPANETATFSLFGTTFGSNAEKNLKEENNEWKGVYYISTSGYFYLKKNLSSGGSIKVKRAVNASTVDLNTPMDVLEGSGYYWKGLSTGTYTFTYNPTAKTLTVVEGGDMKKYRTKFEKGDNLRIKWNSNDADKVHVWQDGGSDIGSWPGDKSGDGYRDVTITSETCDKIGYILTKNGSSQQSGNKFFNFTDSGVTWNSTENRFEVTVTKN